MVETQRRQEDRLVRNVLFTFFASGAMAQPLGSFIPFLRRAHGLSYDLSGLLLSAQSVGNLAAVFLAGVLPAYLGRRRSVLATAVWMAVGYAILFSGAGAPWLLLAACAMTGLARGGNSNFANTMISTLPGERATRGYNLLHGAFAVGALLSPLLLIAAAGRWPQAGWRVAAGALCALGVGQVLVYAKMPLPQEPPAEGVKGVDRSFLRVRAFWMSAAMLFFYISTEYAVCGWLVTYFQDVGILTENQSQLMNSLYWVVVFAGRMVGAAVTGKISRSKLLVVDGVGLAAFFLVLLSVKTPVGVILSLCATAFFMATIYPTAFAFGSDCIRGNDLGCSVMILTGSAGGILTPALVGLVAERAGIRAGMAVVAVAAFLLLAAILLSVWGIRKKAAD